VGTYTGRTICIWGTTSQHPERPDPTARQPHRRSKPAWSHDLPTASAPGCSLTRARRVIYELHVKGFTALHPEVPAQLARHLCWTGTPGGYSAHLQVTWALPRSA